MAGKSLAGLELPDEGLLVLAVQGIDGGSPGLCGQTVVHPGDTLILYGRTSVIADNDSRPDSPEEQPPSVDEDGS